MKKILLSLLFALLSNSYAHKLPVEVQKIVDEVMTLDGDVNRGKELSQSCMQCHGKQGLPTGEANDGWTPYIADQAPKYVAIQLAAFKTENRKYGVMNNISKTLSSQDMADLISYYQSYDARKVHCYSDAKIGGDYKRGEELAFKKREFTRGDGSKVKVSCTMCHGEQGIMGNDVRDQTMHPDLAGLGIHYVTKTLFAFWWKTREGGPMQTIVRGLSQQDMLDLGAYYSVLNRCR